MGKMLRIIKKDTVLVISWVLAVVSAFFVTPDKTYAEYIDWRSLGILWSLMLITQGYMKNGVFEKIGHSHIGTVCRDYEEGIRRQNTEECRLLLVFC